MCDILHCDYDSLLTGLVTRSIEVRHHDVLIQDLNVSEAAAARDALCRALYGRMFTWVVHKVNESLKPPPRKHRAIGMLDLFGFEAAAGGNGFHQLAVNYANERLHAAVTAWTIAAEQEEMAAEGIEWQRVDFFDNGRVCGLLEAGGGGGPGGVLALLDEISLRKGPALGCAAGGGGGRTSVSASSDGGESGGPPPPTRAEIFVRRLCETFRQHPHLEVPSSTSENKDGGCSTSLKECFK